MTQKFAIVPVLEAGSSADGTVVAIIGKAYEADQYICVNLAECKITRDLIDIAARAIGLRDGYVEGETGTVEELDYFRQDAIAAFKSIGLEIEE